MVSAELSPHTPAAGPTTPTLPGDHVRRIAAAYLAIWGITAIGAAIGHALPTLAPPGRPHPSQHGTLSDFTAIAATNVRVLSAPFLMTLFRFQSDAHGRRFGDLLTLGLLGGNALRVGLALGRDGQVLLPYVPQLPLEWLAAATAGAAWLTLRLDGSITTTVGYAAAVLVVIAAAAAIETWATPHVHASAGAAPSRSTATALHPTGPRPVRKAGGDLPSPDRAPAPASTSRSLRSLPLAVARFRSAAWPALPDFVNHPRIPQGGTR